LDTVTISSSSSGGGSSSSGAGGGGGGGRRRRRCLEAMEIACLCKITPNILEEREIANSKNCKSSNCINVIIFIWNNPCKTQTG